MDQVLKPHQEYASAYLDDVVIQSPDWESHLPRVQKVLESLRQAGLTVNPKKCKLAFSETNYLGCTIGWGLVKPQEAKLCHPGLAQTVDKEAGEILFGPCQLLQTIHPLLCYGSCPSHRTDSEETLPYGEMDPSGRRSV